MSDWGAVNDRVKGLEAGLDLEDVYKRQLVCESDCTGLKASA